MLGKEAVEAVKALLDWPPPVLSLYVQVNPADPNVSEYTFDYKKKPYVIRAKDTLKALGVPREVAEKALFLLEHDAPQAATRALFVGGDRAKVFDLGVELPVVDLRTGLVEARWGEPYVAPLLFALDEYERYGVVLLDKERWRLFEVFLGEIEEIEDAFRAVAPEEWRRLSESRPAAPRTVGGYAAAARGGTAKDKFDRRLLEWTHRFYKRLAQELMSRVEERGMTRLILMGPEEDTKYFASFLPKSLAERVVAHLPAPGSARAAPGEVLRRVLPEVERIERAEEERLLERVREEGIWGLDTVLDALMIGRVYLWVLPWHVDAEVYYCPAERFAAGSLEAARAVCPEPEKRPLKDLVADLAEAYGARIEFVRGEPERKLTNEFGGMAGLVRW